MNEQVTQQWPGIGRVVWAGGRIWEVVEDLVESATYAGYDGSKRQILAIRDDMVAFRHEGRSTVVLCKLGEFREWAARRAE